MKSKVKLSRYSLVLTVIITVVLYICCMVTLQDKPIFFIILGVFVILLATGMLYSPISIKADADRIVIVSMLKKRSILMQNVESVELFQPTMGAIRICASGGYMGYWGIFREGDIGQYVAYYGKASDCFLVRMKNGDKYVLGCENPDAMVDYIKLQIK